MYDTFVSEDVERFELNGRVFEVETEVRLLPIGRYTVDSTLYEVEKKSVLGVFSLERREDISFDVSVCEFEDRLQSAIDEHMRGFEDHASKVVGTSEVYVSLSSSVRTV